MTAKECTGAVEFATPRNQLSDEPLKLLRPEKVIRR
jgi:hypothetical protein